MPEGEHQATLQLRLRPLETRMELRAPYRSTRTRIYDFLAARLLLLLCVVIPVLFTTIYEYCIAADIFMSEAHFLVRSRAMANGLNGLSETSSLQPLSSMSQSNDLTNAVNDYMASRDLIQTLLRSNKLLELTSRREADFLSRFPRWGEAASVEALHRRFDEFVYPSFDSSTGISTLYTYAFRAEDARNIALAAFEHAEALINRLNNRQQQDSVAFAQKMVEDSREEVRKTEQRITDFRNNEGLFDPARQSADILTLIAKMSGDISKLKAELAEVNISSPGSPKVSSIKARIEALGRQIDEQRVLVAGGDNSLAPKLAIYERLLLEREMAVKAFAGSLSLLEEAVRDMDIQRLYLERVVEPNLPDYPLYPRRFRIVLIVFGFSLCLYWIAKVTGESVTKHEA
jgi:capsular polysaccharide transport system permease protein